MAIPYGEEMGNHISWAYLFMEILTIYRMEKIKIV